MFAYVVFVTVFQY